MDERRLAMSRGSRIEEPDPDAHRSVGSEHSPVGAQDLGIRLSAEVVSKAK
jgi:hypothetical protein